MEDLQCGVILILIRYFGDFHSIWTEDLFCKSAS
jgi:hypothetical protein